MKVLVEKSEVQERSGTSKAGRPFTMRTQAAWLRGDMVAGRIELTLADDQGPYPSGVYEIDFERSVSLGRYGDVMLSRQLVLRGPIVASAQRAA